MILYGAPVRDQIKKDLIARIQKLAKVPALAIVQVGAREDSNIYIKNKIKFGEEIGVNVILKNFKIEGLKNNELEEEIIAEIKRLNNDEEVGGIIVQLPLPEKFDREKILNAVAKEKDADGLAGGGVIPATARAVLTLLDFYKIEVKGQKAAVIGQGLLAGKPIGDALERMGAEVVRCDINTQNIADLSRKCDILVSAVGQPNLITKDFVNNKQTVIDVGISRINGKICGDVASTEVGPIVGAWSPVPGGVGPLTVACLFQNLLDLYLQTMLK